MQPAKLNLYGQNRRHARQRWGSAINRDLLETLKSFSRDFGFSISTGDLVLLNEAWYVTHVGLIRLARRKRCSGILAVPEQEFCNPNEARWAFRATVYKSPTCRGFVGFGDANPSNVSFLVRGAEMRVAETRAVNRALRKAYGIGICSVEEIGSAPNSLGKPAPQQSNSNGHSAAPKLRDLLCQIIRQHKLDPELVKAYAVDFCGTETLREASRELLESFVQQLAKEAKRNRDALLCRLNGYSQPKREEVA